MSHRIRRSITAIREILGGAGAEGLSTRDINKQLLTRGIVVKNLTTTLLRACDVYCVQLDKGTKRMWRLERRRNGERRHAA